MGDDRAGGSADGAGIRRTRDALADTADEIRPSAVEALSALWSNDFLPFAMGLQVFLLATGLSIVRHGVLPKWIGWIAIVLAVVAVTPIGARRLPSPASPR